MITNLGECYYTVLTNLGECYYTVLTNLGQRIFTNARTSWKFSTGTVKSFPQVFGSFPQVFHITTKVFHNLMSFPQVFGGFPQGSYEFSTGKLGVFHRY